MNKVLLFSFFLVVVVVRLILWLISNQADPWEHLIAMGIGGYALEKYVEFGEDMEKKIAEKEKKLFEHKKVVEGNDDSTLRFSFLGHDGKLWSSESSSDAVNPTICWQKDYCLK